MPSVHHPRFDLRRYTIQPRVGHIAVLVSGGLDSSVLLAELARRHVRVHPIYVRTGMRWEREELRVLRRFVSALRSPRVAPITVLRLPMNDIARDHWSVTGRKPPGYRAAMTSNYILGRNLSLLAKAAIFCAQHRIGAIAMAPLEANPFPDARPEFFAAFARAVTLGTGLKLAIRTPYAGLSKADVIRRGRNLRLELTVSCIRPRGLIHCGACTKCAERAEGFWAAGMPDPTRYAHRG